jgi:hypothetical protein
LESGSYDEVEVSALEYQQALSEESFTIFYLESMVNGNIKYSPTEFLKMPYTLYEAMKIFRSIKPKVKE